ncbi:MAG: PadR family transcriptional regulator [Firmicutes bacterium]|nr:PadR family transcriptional regulator [Bacillota bacterium]
MEGQMIKGYIDGILLSILLEGDSYGYAIARVVFERTNQTFEIKEGTLYPALRRLEAEGFIQGYWAEEEQGPRRRYYMITDKGRDELHKVRQQWANNARVIQTFLRGALSE